jgi:hypothetical protein
MNHISSYDEALHFIQRNPGTGGASSLAKLILSLYNDSCGFSFAECIGNLDDRLTNVALRMVQDYAARGESEDLRAAGKVIHDDLYPRLWEMGMAIQDARTNLRSKWEAEDLKAESDALDAAEAALFTDPTKLIPPTTARGLLEDGEAQYAYYHRAGNWLSSTLSRDSVQAAVDLIGGAELSGLCPELGSALAVRIDQRIYYVNVNYDAREAYLETAQGPRRSIPVQITVPPRPSL